MGAKICCICGKEFKGMGHPCYAVGRVIYGCFEPEDRITLLHGGGKAETALTCIRKRASYGAGSPMDQGLGGQPCALEFTGKGLACEPGDLIVRD